MGISNYTIECGMGRSNDWDKIRTLSPIQIEELNNIGYSGKKLNGDRSSFSIYLDEISTKTTKYAIEQYRFDTGDFIETFRVTVVTEDEKVFTKKEVIDLIYQAHSHGYALCMGSSQDALECEDWIKTLNL